MHPRDGHRECPSCLGMQHLLDDIEKPCVAAEGLTLKERVQRARHLTGSRKEVASGPSEEEHPCKRKRGPTPGPDRVTDNPRCPGRECQKTDCLMCQAYNAATRAARSGNALAIVLAALRKVISSEDHDAMNLVDAALITHSQLTRDTLLTKQDAEENLSNKHLVMLDQLDTAIKVLSLFSPHTFLVQNLGGMTEGVLNPGEALHEVLEPLGHAPNYAWTVGRNAHQIPYRKERKEAIVQVSTSKQPTGFYSKYFLVPKKDGGLRPILDLRQLNRFIKVLPFKMLTTTQEPGEWFTSIDLKDAYFHVPICRDHHPFLRFAFQDRVFQFKVLPFGLSLSPRVFARSSYKGHGNGNLACSGSLSQSKQEQEQSKSSATHSVCGDFTEFPTNGGLFISPEGDKAVQSGSVISSKQEDEANSVPAVAEYDCSGSECDPPWPPSSPSTTTVGKPLQTASKIRPTCEDEGYTEVYPDVMPYEEQEVTITKDSFRKHSSEGVDDNNGCLSDRMRSSVGRQICQRSLGASLDLRTYQCAGAQGSPPLPEDFSPITAKQTCLDKDRQYVCSVSQPPGWHQISTLSPVQWGKEQESVSTALKMKRCRMLISWSTKGPKIWNTQMWPWRWRLRMLHQLLSRWMKTLNVDYLFPRRLEAQNMVVSVAASKAGDLDLVSVVVSPLQDGDSEWRCFCYGLTLTGGRLRTQVADSEQGMSFGREVLSFPGFAPKVVFLCSKRCLAVVLASLSDAAGQEGSCYKLGPGMCCPLQRLLLWSSQKLLSLKAVYIPGVANKAEDLMSRTGPLPGECRLHPKVVRLIWGQFGMAKIDLFATAETTHCNQWYSLSNQGDPLGIDASQ
ncbi:Gag-Pol polyprotein [Labeo rohita]|uniref:ribonuclease H n=1 Tax=Labeo rohita TaxID=84645 RepID=A0ABQ8LDX1_LABRO|nr:Gag-Pol polyprotein [Labeo rohita]